ncbi:phage integrase family protein [Dyella mobilis]|uniref:Core-binding (CB) domain-containing protein n=1 Tax=Dyella mobilis TaxID=1849582 RepID=A0ABS2KKC6_9GAMM|nr:phage integrase family protein [Dyella mobilis]MBM7131247.1 hypothetical protein [Dyella mobilis]
MAERKISLSHVAFYRSWLNGLSLRDAADLYLETGDDLRLAAGTMTWIQDTFRRAALRHGRYGDARLIRIRLSDHRTSQSFPADVPTLDEFRARADPDNFYSDDELLTRYRAAYPSAFDARTRRQAALIARQAATLAWLEELLVTEPAPTDTLDEWLDANLISRLLKGGVTTAGELVARMADRGYYWWGAIPGLGRSKGARLVHWVQMFPNSLGALPASVLSPPRSLPARIRSVPAQHEANEAVIVPLGAVREPVCPRAYDATPSPIDVNDDRAAINAWLDARAGGATTRRAYRKEAERLLMFGLNERKKRLDQLTVEDCTAYRDFLLGLGRTPVQDWPFRVAQAEWCSPRHIPRHAVAWRPFEGALSARSVLYALSVVRSLFSWLAAVAYVARDPWPAVATPSTLPVSASDVELARKLTSAAWTHLQEAVAAMPSPSRERADALLWLVVVIGLRRTELAHATTDKLYTQPQQGGGMRWVLAVPGKGRKYRPVPLPTPVMDRLIAWWRVRGAAKTDSKTMRVGKPLVGRLDGRKSSPSGVAQLVKTLFARGLVACRAADDWEAAGVLAKASTYWLRHTTGETLAEAGMLPAQIQRQLRRAGQAFAPKHAPGQQEGMNKGIAQALEDQTESDSPLE